MQEQNRLIHLKSLNPLWKIKSFSTGSEIIKWNSLLHFTHIPNSGKLNLVNNNDGCVFLSTTWNTEYMEYTNTRHSTKKKQQQKIIILDTQYWNRKLIKHFPSHENCMDRKIKLGTRIWGNDNKLTALI